MTKVVRLLDELKPSHYELELDVLETEQKLRGAVKITAKKLKSDKQLRLHADHLNIAEIKILAPKNCSISSFKLDKDNQWLIINLNSPIPVGEVQVLITFEGQITESMVGIYPAKTHNDEVIFATQFESHYAREVFPLIDEPSAKAVFDLKLTTSAGSTALSNTPAKSHTINEDRKITTFEPTPVMSSYLLAFVCGSLDSISTTTEHGTIVSTWATKDVIEHTHYALQTAARVLEELENYFGIAYPLAKCDLVALPEFAAGAMENWGLITFRENGLVFDDHSQLADRQWMVMVITHELAHQWFGNLVTMSWWTDLWLNEGFAQWVEIMLTDKLFPEWKPWVGFVAGDYLDAMALDRLPSSHPVEVQVDDPDTIRTNFDAISYDKGAAVIRMLETYLGDVVFRDGLRLYLKKHSYSNAFTRDLWQALEESSGKPVTNFMHAWTRQVGFPLLSAQLRGNQLELSQKRYQVIAADDASIWSIPVFTDKTSRYLLDDTNGVFQVFGPLDRPLNNLTSGFYVTKYDEQTLKSFLYPANYYKLPEIEQIGLLNDLFALVRAGEAKITDSLAATLLIKEHESADLWLTTLGYLGSIKKVLLESEDVNLDAYNDFVRQITHAKGTALGWHGPKSESPDDELLRPVLLRTLVNAQDPAFISRARDIFTSATEPSAISLPTRSAVFKAGISEPGGYEKINSWYLQARSVNLKQSLAAALTLSSKNISENLEMIKNGQIRLQDLLSWLMNMLANNDSTQPTWQWIQNNIDYLVERFGNDTSSLAYLPIMVAGNIHNITELDEFRTTFSTPKLKGIKNKVAQGEDMIVWKSQWRERDAQTAQSYFFMAKR